MESKSEIAIKKGLKPLADLVWDQQSLKEPLEALARAYVKEGGDFKSVDDVLSGMRHILIGKILNDQALWQGLKNLCSQMRMTKLDDILLQEFLIKKVIRTLDPVICFQLETAISDAYHFVIKSVLMKEATHRKEYQKKIKPIPPVAKKPKALQNHKKREVFGTLADQFSQFIKK